MKSQLLKIFFCAFLSGIALRAMEQAPEAPLLQIQTSKPKVTVVYQYRNEAEPRTKEIVVGDPFELHNLEQLQTLNIVPYGWLREWTAASVVTLGLLRPENLVDQVRRESEKRGNRSITLTVHPGGPGGEYITSWFGQGIIGKTVAQGTEELASYKYTYDAYQPVRKEKDADTKKSYSLVTAFPHVFAASQNNQVLEPYHFLGIGRKSAPEKIQDAYIAKRGEFQRLAQSKNSEERKYGLTAGRFVELAYEAMMHDQTERFRIEAKKAFEEDPIEIYTF